MGGGGGVWGVLGLRVSGLGFRVQGMVGYGGLRVEGPNWRQTLNPKPYPAVMACRPFLVRKSAVCRARPCTRNPSDKTISKPSPVQGLGFRATRNPESEKIPFFRKDIYQTPNP